MSEGRVAVVGAGSWGTALANLLAKKGVETLLWAYEPAVAEGINREHRNPIYLTGIALDARLRATTDVAEAVREARAVVSVSPSHVVRRVMAQAAPHLHHDTLVVSASKGIEQDTLQTMDEVLAGVLPYSVSLRATFLSGPSFALEVAQEHPTAESLAEQEALKAIYAYEEVLSVKRGRRTRATRTWQMVKRHGVIGAVERAVNRITNASGYTALAEMRMLDLSFEAVVLRHPDSFSGNAVARAKERLAGWSGAGHATQESLDLCGRR